MNKDKTPETALVRSSAAEYLTFIAATGTQQTSVEMRYEDENIWLTQKMMATLYDVSVPAINQHLKRIFTDRELDQTADIKPYLITAADGKRYRVQHYNLQAIIAVGFKIENERAVQFRKWANQIVKDYTIQGWVMDAERLKSGGSILGEDFFVTCHPWQSPSGPSLRDVKNFSRKFFERQLEKICETRLAGFLKLWDREILQDAGKVSAELAKQHAESEFEKYRIVQDRLFQSDFDRLLKQVGLPGE